MVTAKRYGRLLYILFLVGLYGCSAMSSNPTAAPAASFAALLPAPSALRQVDSVVTTRTGADYALVWPHSRVAASGTQAMFSPSYGGATRQFTDLAYALYAFDTSGAAYQTILQLEFSINGLHGDSWIAIPDFVKGHWDWFQLPAPVNQQCAIDLDLDGRTEQGVMPVAVVFTGSQAWKLERIKLGGGSLGTPAWKMFQHDAQHTGRSIHCGPIHPRRLWSFDEQLYASNAPAIDDSGHLAIGTSNGVAIFEFDGTAAWKYTDGAAMITGCSPAFGPDNSLYIVARDFADSEMQLSSWDSSAGFKWNRYLGAVVSGDIAPVFGPDGTIYVNSDIGLRAYDSAGNMIWLAAITVDRAPAVATDGTVICYNNMGLYALDSAGNQLWEYIAPSTIHGCPAIGADGTIYIYCFNGTLCAINSAGIEQWLFTAGPGLSSTPAIGADGTIYITSQDGKAYAVNPDGTKAWEFTTGGAISSSPAIDASGTIFFGSDDGLLYALHPDGTLFWAYPLGAAVGGSPVIGADGLLFVGAGTSLVAIGNDGSPQPWTMFMHDAQHTGQSPYVATMAGSLKGTYSCGDEINCAPVFGPDGDLYIGADDGCLYALHSDLSYSWESYIGGYIRDSPLFMPDGSLCCSSTTGQFTWLGHNGSIDSQYDIGLGSCSAPVIDRDGNIYVSGGNQSLHKFDSTGTHMWSQALFVASKLSTPVLNYDNSVVYIAGDDGYLDAFKADSTPCGNCDLGLNGISAPSIGPDGTVYVGSPDGYLYAVNPDCSVKWAYNAGTPVNTSPAVSSNGTVYFGGDNGTLYTLHPDGTLWWSYATGGAILSSPILDAAGKVIFGSSDYNVYALSRDGELLWSQPTGAEQNASAAIGSDGSVYIGCVDTNVYRFGD